MIWNFKKKKKDFAAIKDNSIFDEWANTQYVQGFFNLIDRLPNPDEVLKKAGKNISVLRKIVNHYQVGTCIDSRKAGTKSSQFDLKENGCDKKHYQIYKEVFDNLDISHLIDDILDTPLYGFNPIEIMWEKMGNYILPVKLIAKPQEWFYFNSEGKFFFKDCFRNNKREINLDGFKFLVPRNKASYTNPYGQAILSRCFWMVVFINGGMEFWVKFCEKYGMPFMFGKYDRNMTKLEKDGLLEGLCNMIADAVGVIPNDGTVDVINPGTGANSDIYERLVVKCENNIAKSILGQTLTTDIGANGSYAASQTHACVRADIVNSDKGLVENTINRLIKFINEINFEDDVIPVFEFEKVENLGLQKVERDNKVKNLGVKFSKDYILKTYGYKQEDVTMIEENDNSDFEDVQDKFADFDYFDGFENTKNIISPQLNEIISFFEKSKDAEGALNKLEDLYPNLNNDELEQMLTKIIFIAELKGRTDARHRQR